MPAYCAPWPVNRNATSGGRWPAATAGDDAVGGLAAERTRRALAAALVGVGGHDGQAVGEVGCGPTLAVWATSASATRRCVGQVRRRARSASSRRAGSVRADSVSTCCGRVVGVAGGGSAAGAASSTTWALVPLKPNELTPAMRRPPAGVHGVRAVGTSSGSSSHGMYGFGLGEVQLRRDLAVLQRTARP